MYSVPRRVWMVFSVLLFMSPAWAHAFFEQFRDPKDGAFDTSNWLIEQKGFLPVPIFVSEPAVGYGGGAALLFFHESAQERTQGNAKNEDEMLSLPPSISVVGGAYTQNDSWLAVGGHFGSWKEDHIRYIGAIGGASLNLQFYGIDGEEGFPANSLDFSIDGLFFLQEMTFRIRESNFFLGGRYVYLDANVNFDDISDGDVNRIPGVSQDQLDSKDGGLGFLARYDSRNNIFSPERGHYAELQVMKYDEIFGGDFDYTYVKASSLSWWELFSDVVLGVRLDGRFAGGDPPFYAVPYIDIRGIPALRYQGENVLVAEIEPRWDLNYRWSLVGFLGGGWTSESISGLGDASNEFAGGVGFRYLAARRLGMRVGLDIARGPEDTVLYITVGSGWR